MTEYKTYNTVVIGSGAAGYQAACRLHAAGVSVCIVTEGKNRGTSRNTGSDKQTYYKLGLAGDAPDSVENMARDLFAGGSVDGDNALCEAALSPRCFYRLAELGVPFPANRYGEFVGYKTDHDPYARATSAGPLTSKFMTEALEAEAERLGVILYDGMYAAEILKSGSEVAGLICLDLKRGGYTVFRCANIILATGGPAGIYEDSVYPIGHTGSSSLALHAGAAFQNLTEWQYGLASVAPRWNVSGTYMQVLPRFVSVDCDGTEREFLSEYFSDPYEALSHVFLKGYQWPFDSAKVLTGSSVIDLLVYRETVMRGRKVYLDYRTNPFGLEEINFEALSEEAKVYLRSAGADFGTPIARLEKMNTPAIELYRSKGVDITTEKLEIALCAQHNNGGVAVDAWWQSSVTGLFAAGECAGTHGITRPGGSALNAGQVGAVRAAAYITRSNRVPMEETVFAPIADAAISRHTEFIAHARTLQDNAKSAVQTARKRMSGCGGAIRNIDAMKEAKASLCSELLSFSDSYGIGENGPAASLYRLKDTLTVQLAVLSALIDYAETVGASRGSALYYDATGDLRKGLDEKFRLSTSGASHTRSKVQMITLADTEAQVTWRDVRPIPQRLDVFEVVWKRYREDGNVY